jgi:hypothetical protein
MTLDPPTKSATQSQSRSGGVPCVPVKTSHGSRRFRWPIHRTIPETIAEVSRTTQIFDRPDLLWECRTSPAVPQCFGRLSSTPGREC